MCLQVTARHAEGADRCERARDRQLIQQLVHQDAGASAALQLQPGTIQRAEIPLLQEAAQTAGTESVTARRVQGLHQRLQADLTHKVIVHLQPVVVQVVLPGAVNLPTLNTQSLQESLAHHAGIHAFAQAAHRATRHTRLTAYGIDRSMGLRESTREIK